MDNQNNDIYTKYSPLGSKKVLFFIIGIIVIVFVFLAWFFISGGKIGDINIADLINTNIKGGEEWLTYHDDQFGFSIQYPQNYEVKLEDRSRGLFLAFDSKDISLDKAGESYSFLIINITEQSWADKKAELEAMYFDPSELDRNPLSEKEITISGVSGKELKYNSIIGREATHILVGYSNYIYDIQSLEGEHFEIINKMISTFKFDEIVSDLADINENINTLTNYNVNIDTGDWKTIIFQKAGHNFSIEVPTNFSEGPFKTSLNERESLIFYNSEPEDVDGVARQWISASVSFYNNDDPSLSVWVNKHKEELEKHSWFYNSKLDSVLIDGESGYLLEIEYKRQILDDQKTKYKIVFLSKDKKVYKFKVGGNTTLYESNINIINKIIESFKFIVDQELEVEQIKITDWETQTFQKADHGFSIKIPSDWSVYSGTMGFKERESLLSASTYEEDKSLRMEISFYNNFEMSFNRWIFKHQSELEVIDSNLIKEQKQINNLDIYIYTLGEVKYNMSYKYLYAFLSRNDKVYQIKFTGSNGFYQKYLDAMDEMIESFKFIEIIPLTEIIEPRIKEEVGLAMAYNIEVDWLSEIEELNLSDPMLYEANSEILNRNYYKVGTIINGMYKDKDLLLIFDTVPGMGLSVNIYRTVYDSETKTFTFLEKHSDSLARFTSNFKYDVGSEIPDLAMPEEIPIPNSDIELTERIFYQTRMFSTYNNLELLFVDTSVGDVYYYPDQRCFLIRTPDGLVKYYNLKLNFIKEFEDQEYALSSARMVPNILWLDTTGVSEEYTYNEPTGGCGSSQCHAIFTDEEVGDLNALEITGQTSTGDDVYEYRDKNHEVLKQAYESFYVPQQETKIGYDEFVNSHPLFYWKDPFGHWIRFKKVSFLPAVECGKPVIYLYPEVRTEVNVQVSPTGGFSVTKPEYPDGGWDVVAYPDGRLEYDNNTIYPYLFWEGKGLNYKMPNKGFVVKRSEVRQFLLEKLMLLGLNEQESADFMEFWVPQMQEKPYYFVTFIDQEEFDRLAPLTVIPKPDQVIRVFMDYRPLDAPMSVEPLKIITPKRNGFTVVEWGGALHR